MYDAGYRLEVTTFTKTAAERVPSECSQPRYIGDIFQNAVNLITIFADKNYKKVNSPKAPYIIMAWQNFWYHGNIGIINHENSSFVNAPLVFWGLSLDEK